MRILLGLPILLIFLNALSAVGRCETATDAARLRPAVIKCLNAGDMDGAAAAIVELSQKCPDQAGDQLVLGLFEYVPMMSREPLLNSLTSALAGKQDAISAQVLLARLCVQEGR